MSLLSIRMRSYDDEGREWCWLLPEHSYEYQYLVSKYEGTRAPEKNVNNTQESLLLTFDRGYFHRKNGRIWDKLEGGKLIISEEILLYLKGDETEENINYEYDVFVDEDPITDPEPMFDKITVIVPYMRTGRLFLESFESETNIRKAIENQRRGLLERVRPTTA